METDIGNNFAEYTGLYIDDKIKTCIYKTT